MVLIITASIMVTGLTDISHIVITDTGLTDISVGEAVITGVVTAETMAGEEYMAAAVGMAMAGEDMVGIEMKLCT